mmetsp:Transcript_32540/g.68002  ORF Transcript_32540/g.68002 Transcript_32540/m.68002 type:complete len:95 (-) Transcript_32540:383-667(-)
MMRLNFHVLIMTGDSLVSERKGRRRSSLVTLSGSTKVQQPQTDSLEFTLAELANFKLEIPPLWRLERVLFGRRKDDFLTVAQRGGCALRRAASY